MPSIGNVNLDERQDGEREEQTGLVPSAVLRRDHLDHAPSENVRMSHVILVLGCHRSGTSLVARSLKCLGAELGPRAQWSGPDNVTGFWEDQDVLRINQTLMAYTGSTWDSSKPLDWQFVDAIPDGEFRRRVSALIAGRLARYPLWALKEPRLCRLLPFWRRIFYAIGCKVSVVHVVRHPMAVARSLEKRNGIPTDQGLALWAEYTRNAHEDVDAAWKACTVNYDAMMVSPERQVQRIGEKLGLPLNEPAAHSFAMHFVNDELWHQVADDTVLPPAVGALWKQVSDEAAA